MKVIKDGKVHIVTEKAFRVIYKERGYKLHKSDNQNKVEGLENKTVEELIIIAKEAGLKGYSNMNKEELISLLEGE